MRKLSNYIRSSVEELRKVAWPTRKQAIDSTLIVLAISLLAALYIGVLDSLFQNGYQYLAGLLAGV
ncbi:preprotein translocase subunit SecE [Candidatus Gracilibacteria bacterium]|nr:preprotein translocase subunit SecE [Candidatus Gracilibacteria bacterium]